MSQPAEFFPPQAVRVRGAAFVRAMENNRDYLLRLEPDRLLARFRLEAGLEPRSEIYGGWEAMGIAGHSLGHYLSALSLLFGATGDERLKERAAYVVSELAACQIAQGNGIIGATPGGRALYERIARGDIETQGAFSINGGWVPLYTLHKVFAGLLDAYRICEIELARETVVRLADWCESIFGHLSIEPMQRILEVEHGGIAESLAEVWHLTRNPRHLALARAFRHEAVFEPALRGEDALNGRHANTQIPKFIGYARLGELTGEIDLQQAARNFWDFVAQNRSFAIGGNSNNEHFFPTQGFESAMIGGTGPETCNTYNMLRLTRQLWAGAPDAAMMDFYERGLWNHILASQHPQSGAMVYFSGVRPGAYRTYSSDFDSFWCCVGTGMENPGKYGEAIYAHRGDTLFVNQFIDSTLDWAEQGARLRQRTEFPAKERTRLILGLDAPRELTLAVRYPKWVEAGALRITLNGEELSTGAGPGEYLAITRLWRDGDEIEIELPMRLGVQMLPGSENFAALTYGPLVLAAKLGGQNLETADLVGSHRANERLFLPFFEQPALVGAPQNVLEHLHRVAGTALVFESRGGFLPRDVTLVPFYQLHDERYSLYFPVFESETAYRAAQSGQEEAAARDRELQSRIVDSVQPGEQQPEIDHNLRGENTTSGRLEGRGWREAGPDGWFAFDLKSVPDVPLRLECHYRGGDEAREFDVFAGDILLATQKIAPTQMPHGFEVSYPIPLTLTTQKTVTIRWQSKPGNIAGALLGCRIIRD